MSSFYFLCIIALFLVISIEASITSHHGQRILAVIGQSADKTRFSAFFDSLTARGHSIEFVLASSKTNLFRQEGIKAYDHLVHLAAGSVLQDSLAPTRIVDFMRAGGSVLMAVDENMSESHVHLARQFGLVFNPPGKELVTPQEVSNTNISIGGWSSLLYIKRGIVAPNSVVSYTSKLRQRSIVFKGLGHSIVAKKLRVEGHLIPVLLAPVLARQKLTELGIQSRLISAFQALNNARFVIIGSLDALDQKWVAESSDKIGVIDPANEELWSELTRWVLGEKSIVRAVKILHENANGLQEYRIKDKMNFIVDLQERLDGEWRPFVTEKLQLSIRMIDPYIRKIIPYVPITKDSNGNVQVSRYSIDVQLPDVYGVFTLSLSLRDLGFSFVVHEDRVPILPPLHDSYPRYLPIAFPYYVGAFAQIFALLVFVALWSSLHNSNIGKINGEKRTTTEILRKNKKIA